MRLDQGTTEQKNVSQIEPVGVKERRADTRDESKLRKTNNGWAFRHCACQEFFLHDSHSATRCRRFLPVLVERDSRNVQFVVAYDVARHQYCRNQTRQVPRATCHLKILFKAKLSQIEFSKVEFQKCLIRKKCVIK